MAINKIQGNILSDNLQRGSNLAIQTDLLYVDVFNNRIGVNTAGTTHTLTLVGDAKLANIVVADNTISAATNIVLLPTGNVSVSNVNINNLQEPVANTDAATKFYVDSVSGNVNFDISDGANTQTVVNGQTITFSSVTNETTVIVGATDTVTIGLPDDVILGNSLSAAYVQGTVDVVGGNLVAGNVVISSATGNIDMGLGQINNLGAPSGNADAVTKLYVDQAVGNVVDSLGNITFSNTTISTSVNPGNITLQPTGNSEVIIDTTSGLVIPVGNTAQQPSPAAPGTIRFNTDTGRVEVYDGVEWDTVAAGVTNQTLYGDNSTLVFTLDRETTAAAALVAFNGVIQLPGVAYTVTGNLITFAQPPAVADVIDIRFL